MNEVATTHQGNPVVQFKADLKRLIDAKELALPSTVSVEAFRNAAVVAVQDNPSILRCDPSSVFRAIRKLAGAGLVPDGRDAAIVPFKGQAQAMPTVAGLRKIARNSGEITSLWDEVIYDGELFSIEIEDGERKFRHTQADGSPLDALSRGGDVRGAYAVAKLKDGTIEFLTMNLEQIEKRRRASASQRGQSQPTGVWKDWFEEMARKTVVRALCNKLPMSAEDVRRIMAEDESNETQLRDVTPDQDATRKNLAQRLSEAESANDAPEAPEAIDGEVMAPDGADEATGTTAHWTDENPGCGAPGTKEWDEGMDAFDAGRPARDCPYDDGSNEAADWLTAYYGKKEAAK